MTTARTSSIAGRLLRGKSRRSTAVAAMAAQGSSADASVTRVASDLPGAGRKIALPRNQVFDLPHLARSHSAARPILDGAAAAIEL